MMRAIGAAVVAALAPACATGQSPPAPVRVTAEARLVASSPSAGSTVIGPVNDLVLRFNPPARLDEVMVTGPNGIQPMKVHALGEAEDYSIPLPGLGAGSYSVNWRATAGGQEYRGNFGFTVK